MNESGPQLLATERKRVATLLTIAQLGYAHWFFGNLYEAVAKVPDRLVKDYELDGNDRRLASVLSSGSPVRYYLPALPVVIGGTLSAVLAGWRQRNERAWLAALAVSSLAGVVTTAWLVRTVNLKLFIAGHPLTRADQDRLLRIWYRVNGLRLLAAGAACSSLRG
jgi:O-antigen ligase